VETSAARQNGEAAGSAVNADALIETLRQLAAKLHPARSAIPGSMPRSASPAAIARADCSSSA